MGIQTNMPPKTKTGRKSAISTRRISPKRLARLATQVLALRAHLKKYPEHYNLGNFKDGEKWVNS